MRAGFIIDDGDGTISVVVEQSWNTPENKPNQLAKYNLDEPYPTPPVGVPAKYWAWNGSEIVEASQAVKDAVDAADAVQAQADKDALKATITAALTDPVTAVLVRAFQFFGGLHGFTEAQVNAKLVEWVDAEVNS
jgi:hypothetical protein